MTLLKFILLFYSYFNCFEIVPFDLKVPDPEKLIEKKSMFQVYFSSDRFFIRELIEAEVSQSLRRVNPLLTAWILLAVLVPSASVLSILILFFKVTQNNRRFSQKLDALKDDFIPEFYAKIAEAQDIVYDLQDCLQVTEATLQGIQTQLDSLSTQDDDLEEYTLEDDKHRLRNRRVIPSKS